MSVDPQTLVEMQDRFDQIIETGEWGVPPPDFDHSPDEFAPGECDQGD